MSGAVAGVIAGLVIAVALTTWAGINTDPIDDLTSGGAMLLALWLADALKEPRE